MRLKELYTVAEVAKALHKTPTTIRNYYRQGRIKTVDIAGRPMIPEDEMRRIVEKGLRPVSAKYRKYVRTVQANYRKRKASEGAAV